MRDNYGYFYFVDRIGDTYRYLEYLSDIHTYLYKNNLLNFKFLFIYLFLITDGKEKMFRLPKLKMFLLQWSNVNYVSTVLRSEILFIHSLLD